MDGQRPPATNSGSKNFIPGVPANLLPAFLSGHLPSQQTPQANNLQWPQLQSNIRNLVDQQTRNNVYNMLNMGSGGQFTSAWDGTGASTSTQSAPNPFAPIATNPLFAAFQQQSLGYMGGKANSMNSSSFNPLLVPSSSTSNQPSFLDPPKQQSHSFSSLPSTSHAPIPPSFPGLTPSSFSSSSNPFGDLMKLNQSLLGAQQPGPSSSQPPPIARPVAVSSSHHSTAPFNSLLAANKTAADSLSQLFQQQLQQQLLSSTSAAATASAAAAAAAPPVSAPPIPSITVEPPLSGSSSGLGPSAPLPPLNVPTSVQAGPSTGGSLGVPRDDNSFISPRTGQLRRRSGGDPNRPPSEGGLDLDFDLFEGIDQNDQDDMLNMASTIDLEILNDPLIIPTSAAEVAAAAEPAAATAAPPETAEKPAEETVKSAAGTPAAAGTPKVTTPHSATGTENKDGQSGTGTEDEPLGKRASARDRMAHFLAKLKSTKTTPSEEASSPLRTTPFTPSTSVVTSLSGPSALSTTPSTSKADDDDDKLTFTPPLSPVDDWQPTTNSSGISSLISDSLRPSDILQGSAEKKSSEKAVPIYLRDSEPCALPTYKRVVEMNKSFGKDEFAFTDDEEDLDNDEAEAAEEDKPVAVVPQGAQSPGAEDSTTATADSAPRYVSKMGFEVKETDAERSQRKLISVYPERRKTMSAESITFTERVSARRQELMSCQAIVKSLLNNNSCAADSKQKCDDVDRPPLPRLLIRIPKHCAEQKREHRRKKKRRHYYEEDDTDEEDSDDWYGEKPKKKRGRKKKHDDNPDDCYSSRLVDACIIENAKREAAMRLIKAPLKLRISKGNRVDPDFVQYHKHGVEGKIEARPLPLIVADFKPPEVRERLDLFRPCIGYTHRGTFLVLKSDIGTPDCALWRVDNMNLLQKFPIVDDEDDEEYEGEDSDYEEDRLKRPELLTYKNSSTYSGWCEELTDIYMIIEVQHIVQTRTVSIVRPIVPINHLFPATTEEMKNRMNKKTMKQLVNKKNYEQQSDARTFILMDDVRNALYMVLRFLMDRSIAINFYSQGENEITPSDPEYDMFALVEAQLNECIEIIDDLVMFERRFEKTIERYARVHSRPMETEEEATCEACSEALAVQTMQFFNLNLSVNEEEEEEDRLFEYTWMPTRDCNVCANCCKLATWKSKLIHFRFNVERQIEDKVIEAAMELPNYKPVGILELMRRNYLWMKDVIAVHMGMWDEIRQFEDEDDDRIDAEEIERERLREEEERREKETPVVKEEENIIDGSTVKEEGSKEESKPSEEIPSTSTEAPKEEEKPLKMDAPLPFSFASLVDSTASTSSLLPDDSTPLTLPFLPFPLTAEQLRAASEANKANPAPTDPRIAPVHLEFNPDEPLPDDVVAQATAAILAAFQLPPRSPIPSLAPPLATPLIEPVQDEPVDLSTTDRQDDLPKEEDDLIDPVTL